MARDLDNAVVQSVQVVIPKILHTASLQDVFLITAVQIHRGDHKTQCGPAPGSA